VLYSSAYAQAKHDPPPVKPLTPGFVSVDGIIKFEDVEKLPPEMQAATTNLRSGNHAVAIRAFRTIEDRERTNSLAYRGEVQGAFLTNTLNNTIDRFKSLLDEAPEGSRQKAVLHYAVACALFASRVEKQPWDPPGKIGTEPQQHLEQALKIWPEFFVAYLQLAIYYEHRSQDKGTEARKCYEKALRLRPDLDLKIRFLHAISWARPGYVKPEQIERLKKQGIILPADSRSNPDKTISECKAIINDYPNYLPAYEWVAAMHDIQGSKEQAARYRELAKRIRD
jgi:tetratricopeptide (TPR) repeat protein